MKKHMFVKAALLKSLVTNRTHVLLVLSALVLQMTRERAFVLVASVTVNTGVVFLRPGSFYLLRPCIWNRVIFFISVTVLALDVLVPQFFHRQEFLWASFYFLKRIIYCTYKLQKYIAYKCENKTWFVIKWLSSLILFDKITAEYGVGVKISE